MSMNKCIYGIVLAICFSACTDGKNSMQKKDPILTIEAKDSLISDMDSVNIDTLQRIDTLQYSILDTLQNGEILYIKESVHAEEGQSNDTATLYLYNYNNGISNLIDSITIEGFNLSPLSRYPSSQWLDTCYILNDTIRAYVHEVNASNYSNEYHMSESRIDFIAVSPNSIRHILSDDLYFWSCRNYMSAHEECEGTNCTFKTADTKTNGYFDIIVTENGWHENVKDGERIGGSGKKTSYRMKYKDGKYEKEGGN